MNILIIGNGFDLAHELPTKYPDFLEFCKRVFPVYENAEGRGVHLYQQEYLFDWDFNKEIKEKLESAYSSRRKITTKENVSQIEPSDLKLNEMYTLIKDNIWIQYFLPIYTDRKKNGKDGWIDFEGEISEVIQSLDADMHGLSQIYNIEDIVYNLSNNFLEEIYADYIDAAQPINPVNNGFSEGISFKKIRDRLLSDLNRLIRGFEIYLAEYIEKIEIRVKSPDIDKLEINKVLSFNYTDTFSRQYKIPTRKEIDFFEFIHGKADINNTIESNNMVLGIDEYLPDDRKNKEVEFVAFKKYYQRIYKGTGGEYKKWIEEIHRGYMASLDAEANCRRFLEYSMMRNDLNEAGKWLVKSFARRDDRNSNKHNLYIFGHSLDITDKDVLKDLILNDNVYTTIFYLNKDVMRQQIANLVKVIGQDELIRRTGESTKTIEFKQQQDMVDN